MPCIWSDPCTESYQNFTNLAHINYVLSFLNGVSSFSTGTLFSVYSTKVTDQTCSRVIIYDRGMNTKLVQVKVNHRVLVLVRFAFYGKVQWSSREELALQNSKQEWEDNHIRNRVFERTFQKFHFKDINISKFPQHSLLGNNENFSDTVYFCSKSSRVRRIPHFIIFTFRQNGFVIAAWWKESTIHGLLTWPSVWTHSRIGWIKYLPKILKKWSKYFRKKFWAAPSIPTQVMALCVQRQGFCKRSFFRHLLKCSNYSTSNLLIVSMAWPRPFHVK